jgi:hypothetical protein
MINAYTSSAQEPEKKRTKLERPGYRWYDNTEGNLKILNVGDCTHLSRNFNFLITPQ